MNHKFPYKWNLSDGYPAKGIEKNNCNVFGTFICGGGSTMGYKLAGYNHLGGVEIDKKIAEVYKLNHDPKYLYVEDIRLFNERNDLPDELYQLDILDGSPPCSTFSLSGLREKDWGRKKKFREGQEIQTLDDLVFVYCDTIIKLQPKTFVLENVKGLISGNAKVYCKNIVNKLTKADYNVQTFCLNGASMGVPQTRERVFIVGIKQQYVVESIKFSFNEKQIPFKLISDTNDVNENMTDKYNEFWSNTKEGSTVGNYGSNRKQRTNSPLSTITSSGEKFHPTIKRRINNNEYISASTFPVDYNFNNTNIKYMLGMSVPPVMTAQIAHQIWLQWLSKIK